MSHWYFYLFMSGVWSAGRIEIQPSDQSDKYQCHIDTAIFSWRWAHGCSKYV